MTAGDFLAPPEWVERFVEQMGGPFGDVPTDSDRIVELEAALRQIIDELTDPRDPGFGADDPAVIIARSALGETA